MVSLVQIESDLISAMKAKDPVAVDVLRGLKTRIQNEKVAKLKAELAEEEILALFRSELKRRKEAAESFKIGARQELADKELAEASILEKYLPAQLSEEKIGEAIDELLKEKQFTAKDFGLAMKELKTKVGNSADGAMLAKVLKIKLSDK